MTDAGRRLLAREGHSFVSIIAAIEAEAAAAEHARILAALPAALHAVWPHHTEGMASYPPSETDRTWEVLDLAALTPSLAAAIAAELPE